MIQRIQTIYLLGSIIVISIVTFGMDFITFTGEKTYALNGYGIIDNASSKMISDFPAYLLSIVLILALLLSIISFKSLKKQLNFVKIGGLLYCLLLIGIVIFFFSAPKIENETNLVISLNTGFYLLFAGFSLVFLALKSIKKDIQLLDSLNRLR